MNNFIFILRKYNFLWAREQFSKPWLKKFGTWPKKGSPALFQTVHFHTKRCIEEHNLISFINRHMINTILFTPLYDVPIRFRFRWHAAMPVTRAYMQLFHSWPLHLHLSPQNNVLVFSMRVFFIIYYPINEV
jgi:hypothetical protein